MKKFTLVTLILIGIAAASAHAQINQALVGSWDWQPHMPGVLVLHADGQYLWIAVDYGAMGWRWSSRGGTVWSTHPTMGTGPFFHYRLIDANTLRIEYADLAVQMGVTGVFYLSRSR
ncbi:MAG: hypothetical protein FWB82_05720 [Treponema sp.]|nr:hypothetical protein [Treponema sp.]